MTDRSFRGRRLVRCFVVFALLVTACSSDHEPAASEPGEVATADLTEPDSADPVGFSVLGSLAEVPASVIDPLDGRLLISTADIDAAAAIAGVRRPEDLGDIQELIGFVGPLFGPAPDDPPDRTHIEFPELLSVSAGQHSDEFIDEFGFHPIAVTSFVDVKSFQGQFLMVRGVSLGEGLPQVTPGIFTVGEGEDLVQNLDTNTFARPLGRPHRVAMRDDLVGISLQTEPLEAWLGQTAAPTLADDPVLGRVARLLDEQEVVSAYIQRGIAPIGLGWGQDSDGPLGVVVVSFASEAEAAEHFAAISNGSAADSTQTGEPVRGQFTTDSIEQRGSEVVATVRFTGAITLLDLLAARAGPLAALSG